MMQSNSLINFESASWSDSGLQIQTSFQSNSSLLSPSAIEIFSKTTNPQIQTINTTISNDQIMQSSISPMNQLSSSFDINKSLLLNDNNVQFDKSINFENSKFESQISTGLLNQNIIQNGDNRMDLQFDNSFVIGSSNVLSVSLPNSPTQNLIQPNYESNNNNNSLSLVSPYRTTSHNTMMNDTYSNNNVTQSTSSDLYPLMSTQASSASASNTSSLSSSYPIVRKSFMQSSSSPMLCGLQQELPLHLSELDSRIDNNVSDSSQNQIQNQNQSRICPICCESKFPTSTTFSSHVQECFLINRSETLSLTNAKRCTSLGGLTKNKKYSRSSNKIYSLNTLTTQPNSAKLLKSKPILKQGKTSLGLLQKTVEKMTYSQRMSLCEAFRNLANSNQMEKQNMNQQNSSQTSNLHSRTINNTQCQLEQTAIALLFSPSPNLTISESKVMMKSRARRGSLPSGKSSSNATKRASKRRGSALSSTNHVDDDAKANSLNDHKIKSSPDSTQVKSKVKKESLSNDETTSNCSSSSSSAESLALKIHSKANSHATIIVNANCSASIHSDSASAAQSPEQILKANAANEIQSAKIQIKPFPKSIQTFYNSEL